MTVKEIEAAALSLSEEDRARLVQTLLASVPRRNGGQLAREDDAVRSIWDMDVTPADGGPVDGSVNHDVYLYANPD